RAGAGRCLGPDHRAGLRDRCARGTGLRRRQRGAAAGAAGGRGRAGRAVPADPRASARARRGPGRTGRGAPGASGGGRDRTGRRRKPGSAQLRRGLGSGRGARRRGAADRGDPARACRRQPGRGRGVNLPGPPLAPTRGDAALDPLLDALAGVKSVQRVGRVVEAYGTLIRATGLKAAIGELCHLRNADGDGDPSFDLAAEVVGVSRQHTLLTPLGALDGISATTQIVASGRQASVRAGPGLLGRILDAHGEPIDDRGPTGPGVDMPIYAASPNPLTRRLIDRPFSTGVRAIDAVMTAGEGQRVGIFAVAGGGKSTLLGMLARGGDADVNVIVLVGERGREVNEFIHDNLGEAGLAKSVIVVATSDRPALERSRAAWVGTAIA